MSKYVAFTSGITSILRGASQVMFQSNALCGLLFIIGVCWGAFESGMPQVGLASVVGLLVPSLAGLLTIGPASDGKDGLWGFNGILVGCGLATFLQNNVFLWVSVVFFSLVSTWCRTAFNNLLAPVKCSSLTFPFVFLTWVVLLAARSFHGLELASSASTTDNIVICGDFLSYIEYCLKGISQVFLIDSWITGILFLVGLAVSSMRSAIWAAVGSVIGIVGAIVLQADADDVANGIYGFNPVLTAIALGSTFYAPGLKSCLCCIAAIITTVVLQGALIYLLSPWHLPTLTVPFCIATWLFLWLGYDFSNDIVKNNR